MLAEVSFRRRRSETHTCLVGTLPLQLDIKNTLVFSPSIFFGRDSVLFLSVLIIEILGLWLLAYGYWDRNGIRGFSDEGAWVPVAIAFAALILDLLAAIFHHLPLKSKLNLLENEWLLPRSRRMTSDQDGNKRWVVSDLEWRRYLMRKHNIRLFRWVSRACVGIILLLAIAKITAVQLFLPSAISNNLKPLIVVSYLYCAFLHILISGYFLLGLVTKWGFPPFIPLYFQQKGENQERDLHLSHASNTYEASFVSEAAEFRPLECLLDDEPPFEIRRVVVSEDPAMKQLDSAYHCLSIIALDLPSNHADTLSRYGLDVSALDKALHEIPVEPKEWSTLLNELGAFPQGHPQIKPDTVSKALGHAQNVSLRTLVDRRYVFSTYGLLRDEHLSRFMADQPDSAKPAVMRWAHYAQFHQLPI
jgi:hypothetical protein